MNEIEDTNPEEYLEEYPANLVIPEPLPEVVASTLAKQREILEVPEIET